MSYSCLPGPRVDPSRIPAPVLPVARVVLLPALRTAAPVGLRGACMAAPAQIESPLWRLGAVPAVGPVALRPRLDVIRRLALHLVQPLLNGSLGHALGLAELLADAEQLQLEADAEGHVTGGHDC